MRRECLLVVFDVGFEKPCKHICVLLLLYMWVLIGVDQHMVRYTCGFQDVLVFIDASRVPAYCI